MNNQILMFFSKPLVPSKETIPAWHSFSSESAHHCREGERWWKAKSVDDQDHKKVDDHKKLLTTVKMMSQQLQSSSNQVKLTTFCKAAHLNLVEINGTSSFFGTVNFKFNIVEYEHEVLYFNWTLS